MLAEGFWLVWYMQVEPMILKQVYKNDDLLFSVYLGADGTMVLVAVVPAVIWYQVAMVLDEDERAVVEAENKEDLILLARDFVASRDMPIYRGRKIPIRDIDTKTIEIDDSYLATPPDRSKPTDTG